MTGSSRRPALTARKPKPRTTAPGTARRFTDGKGHTTTYTYDARGELVKQTDALGRATRYGYDQTGNRTSVTDANGKTTGFTFDAAHQLTGIAYNDPATPDVTFAYDADGRRSAMTDGVGRSEMDLRLARPPHARIDARAAAARRAQNPRAQRSNSSRCTEELAYSYDLAGRLTQTLYPGQLDWDRCHRHRDRHDRRTPGER